MLTPVQKVLFGKKIDFILHTPGNYRGGILEMTIVLDHELEKEYVKELTQDIISACKMHSEVFRNVRLNVVDWVTANHVNCQVIPMPVLQMGTYFVDWDCEILDGVTREKSETENYIENTPINDELERHENQQSMEHAYEIEKSCPIENHKVIDQLLGYLKKYHARSKLVIVLTGNELLMESHSKVMENLSPFLKKKILIVQPDKMMDGKDFISLKTPIVQQ